MKPSWGTCKTSGSGDSDPGSSSRQPGLEGIAGSLDTGRSTLQIFNRGAAHALKDCTSCPQSGIDTGRLTWITTRMPLMAQPVVIPRTGGPDVLGLEEATAPGLAAGKVPTCNHAESGISCISMKGRVGAQAQQGN